MTKIVLGIDINKKREPWRDAIFLELSEHMAENQGNFFKPGDTAKEATARAMAYYVDMAMTMTEEHFKGLNKEKAFLNFIHETKKTHGLNYYLDCDKKLLRVGFDAAWELRG